MSGGRQIAAWYLDAQQVRALRHAIIRDGPDPALSIVEDFLATSCSDGAEIRRIEGEG